MLAALYKARGRFKLCAGSPLRAVSAVAGGSDAARSETKSATRTRRCAQALSESCEAMSPAAHC